MRVRRLHLTASAIALTLALGTTGFLAPGANQALETRDGAVDATLLSGGVDQWFTRTKGEDTDAVLTDALGSPVALGAADGSMRARYAYDPYGGSTVTGDVRGADLGFTGRQDDGTGLRYYRDRYYSPSLGRFVSEDPIGLAGGDNLYAYALNAPTVYTDPTGNSPLVVACIGGAAFGGGWSWAEQRLSGRKVDWGWSGVGGQAAAGCLMGGAQAAIAARLAGRLAESASLWRTALEDPGLSKRGLRPQPGTRVRPDGIPDNWRVTGTDTPGGTRYYDPSKPGNSVRVMQGNPNSPYLNSQGPYVRWQKDGQPLDVNGNKLPSAKDPAAHIPLDIFQFLLGVFS